MIARKPVGKGWKSTRRRGPGLPASEAPPGVLIGRVQRSEAPGSRAHHRGRLNQSLTQLKQVPQAAWRGRGLTLLIQRPGYRARSSRPGPHLRGSSPPTTQQTITQRFPDGRVAPAGILIVPGTYYSARTRGDAFKSGRCCCWVKGSLGFFGGAGGRYMSQCCSTPLSSEFHKLDLHCGTFPPDSRLI